MNEEEKKELFEKLKTKQKFIPKNVSINYPISLHNQRFNRFNDNKKNSLVYFSNYMKGSKLKKDYIKNSFTFSSINIKPKTKKEYKSLKKSLINIDNDPLIDNIKKLKKKIKIINSEKKKKKNKMIGIDIFNYDKLKWRKNNLKESEKIIIDLKNFDKRRVEWINKISSSILEVRKIEAIKHNTENIKFKKIESGLILVNPNFLKKRTTLI